MRPIPTIAASALAAIAGVTPVSAHHSYAMFEMEKTVTIKGTIEQFDWTNPHTYIWMYVANGKGGQDRWAVEGGSPNALSRIGWSKRTIKPGDKVTMQIHPLKDGRSGGFFSKITLSDGKTIEQLHEGERGGPGGRPPAPTATTTTTKTGTP